MRNATRITVATFGTIAALAGIEHGVGEVLQGNRPPDGIVIASWPDAAWFRIVAGEPAMTIIPNLLLSGVVTIIVSLILFVWAALFAQRPRGGLILLGLSLVLLVVGGGFGPPLLGIILGVAAMGSDAPLSWWRSHLPHRVRHALSTIWPWSFVTAIIAWLLVLPGSLLLDAFVGIRERTVYTLIFAAFALLLLTIVAALAHNTEQESAPQQMCAAGG
jgi:hypothetical protein